MVARVSYSVVEDGNEFVVLETERGDYETPDCSEEVFRGTLTECEDYLDSHCPMG